MPNRVIPRRRRAKDVRTYCVRSIPGAEDSPWKLSRGLPRCSGISGGGAFEGFRRGLPRKLALWGDFGGGGASGVRDEGTHYCKLPFSGPFLHAMCSPPPWQRVQDLRQAADFYSVRRRASSATIECGVK
jgi:hypothetical protein